MRLSSVAFVFLALGLTSCASAPATQQEYWISTSIPFAENSGVPDKVKAECNLGTLLSELIAAKFTRTLRITRATAPVEDLEKNSRTVLDIQFTEIFGRPGGVYSGIKKVEVHGELRKDGEVLASFLASRRTRFASGGTCYMLSRCVRAIGRDITPWLENPIMDAKLGEAR